MTFPLFGKKKKKQTKKKTPIQICLWAPVDLEQLCFVSKSLFGLPNVVTHLSMCPTAHSSEV